MTYTVVKKDTSPSVYGAMYSLIDDQPNSTAPWFSEVQFWRSTKGSEVATDRLGERIAADGDLFRLIKQAVEQYDAQARRGG